MARIDPVVLSRRLLRGYQVANHVVRHELTSSERRQRQKQPVCIPPRSGYFAHENWVRIEVASYNEHGKTEGAEIP
jgi:hypothetical protein